MILREIRPYVKRAGIKPARRRMTWIWESIVREGIFKSFDEPVYDKPDDTAHKGNAYKRNKVRPEYKHRRAPFPINELKRILFSIPVHPCFVNPVNGSQCDRSLDGPASKEIA